ncbi:hypothetical protein SLE2022_278930 [Rubroshorea leprosula]
MICLSLESMDLLLLLLLKDQVESLPGQPKLDSHPAGVITMSGTYHKGYFYVGISSLESELSIEQCCTLRGSFVKLDGRSGKILWQTFMLPDNFGKTGEYTGAAIWGSSPPIDTYRNLVYIATGNLYSVPEI